MNIFSNFQLKKKNNSQIKIHCQAAQTKSIKHRTIEHYLINSPLI